MGIPGEIVTSAELDQRSNQLARLWRDHGLGPGDHVAIFSENNAHFLEVMWAALRSGLYITTVNSYLSAEEVAYILDDSGSRALVTTTAKRSEEHTYDIKSLMRDSYAVLCLQKQIRQKTI